MLPIGAEENVGCAPLSVQEKAVSVDATRPRDGYLDVMRGGAVLLVLLLHAGVMTPRLADHRLLHVFFSRCNVGIQLLFVLSGFLVARSWDGLREQPGALCRYVVKRAGKILPLYLLMLHLYLLLHLFFFRAREVGGLVDPIREGNLTWGNYLAHLFFCQGFVPRWLDTLVDGGWSIVCEVYFYVLFPLTLTRRAETAEKAFKIYVFALLFAICLTEAVTGRMEHYYGSRNFFAQLPCFLAGMVAYRVLQLPGAASVLARWASLLASFALILAVGMVHGNLSPVGSHNLYGLLFAAFLVAATHLPQREEWSARVEWLQRMGRQSYALFFSHLVLLKLQVFFLSPRLGLGEFWLFLGLNLLTGIVGAALLSAALLHPIDQFFVRRANRLARELGRTTEGSGNRR